MEKISIQNYETEDDDKKIYCNEEQVRNSFPKIFPKRYKKFRFIIFQSGKFGTLHLLLLHLFKSVVTSEA